MNLRTYVAPCDRYTLLLVHGEIDLTTATALREELVRLVDADRLPVLVDMNAVTFFDSTGLSTLVAAHRHAAERGVAFALVALPDRVRLIFEITCVDKLFAIYDHLSDAVRELAPAP
ncbi:STAS domain-containing protein [Spirillospora sp. CA-294931]|uniref:STAS domain-containing protein n=1 Tax=Spirillospora sp. CA-294931 TaxID=3240042 RepID=UPI003D90C74D